MAKIFLALGSNVGDKLANLEQAVKILQAKVADIIQAPIYATRPVGYTKQDDFLNTAVMGETELSPHELLKFIKQVEVKTGRVERFRWGPREIDIDIIFYGDKVLSGENLTIPHPRFTERDFVLAPLSDLEPDFVDPKSGQTIQQLLDKIPANKRSIISKKEIG